MHMHIASGHHGQSHTICQCLQIRQSLAVIGLQMALEANPGPPREMFGQPASVLLLIRRPAIRYGEESVFCSTAL
jgi:hypothetical protein